MSSLGAWNEDKLNELSKDVKTLREEMHSELTSVRQDINSIKKTLEQMQSHEVEELRGKLKDAEEKDKSRSSRNLALFLAFSAPILAGVVDVIIRSLT